MGVQRAAERFAASLQNSKVEAESLNLNERVLNEIVTQLRDLYFQYLEHIEFPEDHANHIFKLEKPGDNKNKKVIELLSNLLKDIRISVDGTEHTINLHVIEDSVNESKHSLPMVKGSLVFEYKRANIIDISGNKVVRFVISIHDIVNAPANQIHIKLHFAVKEANPIENLHYYREKKAKAKAKN